MINFRSLGAYKCVDTSYDKGKCFAYRLVSTSSGLAWTDFTKHTCVSPTYYTKCNVLTRRVKKEFKFSNGTVYTKVMSLL